jgi:hypothetical protein
MVVKYRKPKTFTRRALLKRAGTAALATSAALVIPRMVHANPTPNVTLHRTWDELLDHVGARLYPMLGQSGPAKDGRHRLREWVHGLVLHPARPQSALLLTGTPFDSRDQQF